MIALVLSIFTLVVSLTPLTTKPTSPFFDIDPDVVYVTNAISYIKRHQIAYTDHPGTPYILILAASYTPLRFYAKYIAHQPFVEWSLENLTFLFLYSRFFVSLLFSLGIFIFLRSIKHYTKSNILTLIAWLLLFTYSQLLRISVRINPENFLPLVYAIWFSLILSLTKKDSFKKLLILNFVSGIALASKFTNLSLPTISGLITLYLFSKNKQKKYHHLFLSLLIIPLGFIVSTWVVRSQYLRLVSWTTGLATHSGIHGSGTKTLLDLSVYKTSIAKLVTAEPFSIKLFFLTPLVFFISLFKFKKKEQIILGITLGTTIIISLIFSKYDHFYYQLPHLFILVSLLVLSLHKLENFKFLLVVIAIILSFLVPKRISTHLALSQGLKKLAALEEQIASNPPKHMTLWEYGPTKDFAAIWGRSWSGEFYGQELTKIYPHLGEMINFKYYRSNKPETLPLFSVCWDQLYIQTATLPRLLNNFPDKNLKTNNLIYNDLTLVTSNHCDTVN